MTRPDVYNVPRRHDRVRAKLWVRYGIDSIDSAGCVESVSEGGLHIHTCDVLEVGTRLILRIEFPDRSVLQRGEVTWAIRVPEHLRDEMVCGMGIRFCDPDADWPEFFRHWQASFAGVEAPALPDPWD